MESVDFCLRGHFAWNLQGKCSCCMCVSCVLHVCCICVALAGVQDRAVTLSKWRACHAERQPVHPATLRNQVKKVSRLSLSVFHLAQPILAHMRTRKQTDTSTNKRPPKLIPMLSLIQCRHHSCVCLQPWVNPIVSFLSPGSSKKQPSHEVPHHRGHVPPVPQFNVVFWILCLVAFKKTAISVDDARRFRSQHWSWGLRG